MSVFEGQTIPDYAFYARDAIIVDYSARLTGHYPPTLFSSVNWALPIIEGFGVVKIGDLVLVPGRYDSLVLPKLWHEHLNSEFREIQKRTHIFSSCFNRLVQVQHNMSNNMAYGRFTVHSPEGDAIAKAPQVIQDAFNTQIETLNKAYIKAVNEAAIASFQANFKYWCNELVELRNNILNMRLEEIKEMINSVPIQLQDKRIYEYYLFLSNQLFLIFETELNKNLAKLQSQAFGDAAKKSALEELRQQAKDDLMDVEMSSAVIQSLVDERVKHHLSQNKNSSQQKKKTTFKPPNKPLPTPPAKKLEQLQKQQQQQKQGNAPPVKSPPKPAVKATPKTGQKKKDKTSRKRDASRGKQKKKTTNKKLAGSSTSANVQ